MFANQNPTLLSAGLLSRLSIWPWRSIRTFLYSFSLPTIQSGPNLRLAHPNFCRLLGENLFQEIGDSRRGVCADLALFFAHHIE